MSQRTNSRPPRPEPVRLRDALVEVAHILGGDTCQEYLGRDRGECGAPARDGLCETHSADRAEWYDHMRRRPGSDR